MQSLDSDSKTAKVCDFDGTVIRRLNSTLLELLTRDFFSQQKGLKKIGVFGRAMLVKAGKQFSMVPGKVFEDHYMTGETTFMQIYEKFMLKEMGMTLSFVEEKAKEYAKLLQPKHVDAFKKCKDDVYIVSAEPTQLLDAVLDNAGISIKGVYGTKFKVVNDVIIGFERIKLFAGMRGKYLGMEKILSNGYIEVHAIGDAMADIGLFQEYNVVPCTFYDAPEKLYGYVKGRGGHIVKDLEEFFTL